MLKDFFVRSFSYWINRFISPIIETFPYCKATFSGLFRQFDLMIENLREKLSYVLFLGVIFCNSSFNDIIKKVLQLLCSELVFSGSLLSIILKLMLFCIHVHRPCHLSIDCTLILLILFLILTYV